MNRLLLAVLMKWKEQKQRKPLLIDGARQTGKTYLLQKLFGQSFNNVLRIDFLESPEMTEAFTGSLSPDDVLNNIELLTGRVFDPQTDLLILDEIGECPKAVTSLKYFAEKGVKTNVTLVFSVGQALLAAKAGATYVSPFIGRLDDISTDGLNLIAEIRHIYDNYNFDTQILAASVRHTMHVIDCAKLGADVMTGPLSSIEGLLKHPLTDIGLAKFLADYNKGN